MQATELPYVAEDEAILSAVKQPGESHVRDLGPSRRDEELPRHTEVYGQVHVALQRQHQELACAGDAAECAALDEAGQVLGVCIPQYEGVHRFHRDDLAPRQRGVQLAAHRLYLGEFGHLGPTSVSYTHLTLPTIL